jgi:hypothetical protein
MNICISAYLVYFNYYHNLSPIIIHRMDKRSISYDAHLPPEKPLDGIFKNLVEHVKRQRDVFYFQELCRFQLGRRM